MGYDVKLNNLKFLAKITISAEEEIVPIDEKTFKIGNNYFSFTDLVEQGYILSLNEPVVLDETEVVESKISEEHLVPETSSDYCKHQDLDIDGSPDYTSDGKPVCGGRCGFGFCGVIENSCGCVEEATLRTNNAGFFSRGLKILKNLLFKITGKVTGLVVEGEDEVVIYIQKDFSSQGYNVGDIINLDPILVRIVEPNKLVSLDEVSKPLVVEKPVGLEQETEGGCKADWKCEENECELDYNLKKVIDNGIFLKWTKTRGCEDLNKCFENKIEEIECELKKKVEAKRYEGYIEIRDENKVLINNLKLTEEPNKKLDIEILVDVED